MFGAIWSTDSGWSGKRGYGVRSNLVGVSAIMFGKGIFKTEMDRDLGLTVEDTILWRPSA
jgi:hypothetical protein